MSDMSERPDLTINHSIISAIRKISWQEKVFSAD